MQHEIASNFGGGLMSMNLLPSSNPNQFTVAEFIYPQLPYSSVYFPSSSTSTSSDSPTATSTTATTAPSSNNSPETTVPSSVSVTSVVPSVRNHNKPLSRLIMEHHDLLNRHKNCLSHLEKTFEEAETLRQENTNLRIANRDLNNRLNLLIQATLENHCAAMMSSAEYGDAALSSVLDQFGGMHIGKGKMTENAECLGDDEYFHLASASPTSVIDGSGRADHQVDVDRVSLPKSISVRSNGYLKQIQASGLSGGNAAEVHGAHLNLSPCPGVRPQKVHVHGGSRKNGPIELDVYNQGMFKTELCNKWQESGSCPYGAHCQFAHGIGELRPIIRHPRYKTEVCRMVLAGDHCPYDHRCHFRHALTEQEKHMLRST